LENHSVEVELEDIRLSPERLESDRYSQNPQEPDHSIELPQIAVKNNRSISEESVHQSEEFEKKKTGSQLPPDYDPKFVTICVLVQFFANLFINIDMGILPAGSTKIKEELGIENSMFGLLGSMVYLG
jgi:hypothetical protein